MNRIPRARFAWNHRWTTLHLSPYLDGELGDRGRNRLLRHVTDCPECRAALESLTTMLRALSLLRDTEPSDPHEVIRAVYARLSDPASRSG
jgi:anti-sigma factor RsiW